MSRETIILPAREVARMNDKIKESLSALVDGELDAFQTRRVLQEADKDSSVDTTWDSYQRIGRVMRASADGEIDLSAGIMAQISGQVVSDGVSPQAPVQTRWIQRWTGQVAVAAGVAAAVLVGVNVTSPVATHDVLANQSAAPIYVAPNQNPLALPATTFARQSAPVAPINENLQAQLKAQIDGYLVRHAENAAASGGQGLLPLARVMQTKPEDTN